MTVRLALVPVTREAASVRRDAWLVPVCIASLLILAASGWMRWSRADDVTRLPEAPRHALYMNTLEALRNYCAPRKRLAGIDDYCTRQAMFALQFPQCDAACRLLAQPYRPHPTR